MRIGDSVFLCNTDEGSVLQLSYPTMKLVRESVTTLLHSGLSVPQGGLAPLTAWCTIPVVQRGRTSPPLQVRTMPMLLTPPLPSAGAHHASVHEAAARQYTRAATAGGALGSTAQHGQGEWTGGVQDEWTGRAWEREEDGGAWAR